MSTEPSAASEPERTDRSTPSSADAPERVAEEGTPAPMSPATAEPKTSSDEPAPDSVERSTAPVGTNDGTPPSTATAPSPEAVDQGHSPPAPTLSSNGSDATSGAHEMADTAPSTTGPQPVESSATPGENDTAAPASGAAAQTGETNAPDVPRRKILIGSRRTESATTPTSTKPQVAGADQPIKATAPASLSPGPVPTPSVRQPLAEDLQQELNSAIEAASMDDILATASTQTPAVTLDIETRHKGTVIRQHGDYVFFALGGRHEGIASLRQFRKPPELGAEIDVVIKKFNREEGLYELAIPGESVHVEDWSDVTEGALVEARITGANTGGLECKVGTIRGFIPSSQIATFRVEDYAQYLDQRMLCVVTEANRRRKNLVLSRRAVLEREKEEKRKELIESLEVGQILEGTVRTLRDFGAFVDIGGVDGLVHVSQLSWERVKHPSEVLQVGQKIRVKIERIDKQTGKIGLSYRDLLEHPWEHVAEKFPPDTVVTGTVSRVAKFGAFVKIAPGVEGLVHISELSYSRVPTVGSVVSEGQEVQVKVLSVDTESQRIALSIKAVLPEPAPAERELEGHGHDQPQTARSRHAAKKRQKPLRGGMDRDSGGEQFGLKW